MNGIHIEQIFVSGVLLGFLYNEDYDYSETIIEQRVITLCFLFIGIKITWW